MGAELIGLASALKKISGFADNADKKVDEGLKAVAQEIERSARTNVPADTGALEGSIRVEVDGPKRIVVLAGEGAGMTVDYAAHVEYGTSKMGAQPFMRPASSSAEGSFEGKMSGHVLRAVNESSER